MRANSHKQYALRWQIEYAGLKGESEKYDLRFSVELKLCWSEKPIEASKAYAIKYTVAGGE